MKTNTEKFNRLTSNFLVDLEKTHKNIFGKTICNYGYNLCKDGFDFIGDMLTVFQPCTFLETGSEHSQVFYSVPLLVSVEWCEHDVYVVFFDSEKELTEDIRRKMQFNSSENGAKYDITPELFVLFQDPLLDGIN